MEKHFVQFESPGTFVCETTVLPIDSWDIKKACEMATAIKERHGATPYGFKFITRSRNDDDLDSSISASSHMYFLGGNVRTIEEVEAQNNPDESILRSNMKCNGIKRVITNSNSWKVTRPMDDSDVVLAWPQ